MDDPRMELPPPEELGEWLDRVRETHNITQTELAARADVSSSQISRIESRQGGAAYETLYRIQLALKQIIEERAALGSPRRAVDVLRAKHDEFGDEYLLAFVEPDTPVPEAVEKMADLNVSQLPVLNDMGESVGRISEGSLLEIDAPGDRVRRYMRPPFPEVGAETPATLVRDLLETNDAVLITPGESELTPSEDHGYVGILTPADFAGGRYVGQEAA